MPRWFYSVAADVTVVVHLAFMLYIILGELLIVAGALAGWDWVRRPWFRWTHLAAILFVVAETFAGVDCPLTLWERDLRNLAGQVNKDQEASFTGRVVRQVLFLCDRVPEESLTVAYYAFGALVLATLVLAPPRRKPKVKAGGPSSNAGGEPTVLKGLPQQETARTAAGQPGR
jgi:hypothetical protein